MTLQQSRPIHSSTTPTALKEWAVVCDALATGTQSILLRKGGIHEGPEGFQPEQEEFWLFPTGFHQSAEGVRPVFIDRARQVLSRPSTPGTIPIQFLCRIRSIHWIADEHQLAALQPAHILSEDSLSRRFHYRKPGLFVLVVETREREAPLTVEADPRYEGCHSWVTLKESLPTAALLPVRSEVLERIALAEEILSRITGSAGSD